ncbi:hypothetical protein DFH06DRAFT_1306728 [Mycena polygramma]|nr:hypothetical protein DFH06DRAFT_1306728 [Mycena polygramma]
MDSDTDADLARAIALSMQEAEAEAKRAPPKHKGTNGKSTHKGTNGSGGSKGTNGNGSRKREPEREVLVISSDEDEEPVVVPVKAKPKSKPTAKAAKPKAASAPAPAPAPASHAQRPAVLKAQEEEAKAPTLPQPDAEAKATPGPLSFLSDRAQMERERLARQKRVRPPSPSPSRSPSSEGDDDSEGEGSGSEGSARKRARMDEGGRGRVTQGAGGGSGSDRGKGKGKATATTTTNGNGKDDEGRRTFPDGALLRVDTKHADPALTSKPPSIRLSELLGARGETAFAVLSAFAVDAPWLYAFFDPETPVVLVGDPNTSGGGSAQGGLPTLKNIFPNWVRVCPPLTAASGYGCMHVKLMLLFRTDGGLRVVVGSANLVPHDWRDVENYVFVQDLPPASPGLPTVRHRPLEKPGESFPAMLARTLRAMGVEEALTIMGRQRHTTLPLPTLLPSALLKSKHKHAPAPSPLETRWDWRRVRAALVPSVPGKWEGWAGEGAVVWTGQPRLLRAVQALGCSLEDSPAAGKSKAKGKARAKGGKWEVELDCLTSSIGTYTPPWIATFRMCAAGRGTGLQQWLDRGRKKTPPQGATRILFPTLETVRGTTMGEGGAGTVFCRRAQWNKISTLVADDKTGLQMRDARSRSGPVGMHTKMILGTLRGPPEPETDPEATESDSETEDDSSDVEIIGDDGKDDADEKGRPHAWLYVGSHNFTPSAWGTLSGNAFNPVLNVTNYELGVVLRLETAEDAAAAVAWERPAKRYGRGDVPWIQEESPFFQD